MKTVIYSLIFILLLFNNLLAQDTLKSTNNYTKLNFGNPNISPLQGKVAPDFDMEDINGKKIKLSALKGKVVFLNFTFLACPPCRIEKPLLQKLANEYKDSVVFISLSRWDTKEKIIAAFAKEPLENIYIIPSDEPIKTNDEVRPTSKLRQFIENEYKIKGYPSSMVIDKNGIIIFYREGLSMKENHEEVLRKGIRKGLDIPQNK